MYRANRIKEIYDRNWDSLYRLCLVYMRNQEDACDMVQETFVRLLRYIRQQEEAEEAGGAAVFQAESQGAVVFQNKPQGTAVFENEARERAWLRKVACNLCKDELRHWWRRKREGMEGIDNLLESEEDAREHGAVLDVLLEMPEKYRVLLYLHYYEGYSLGEIGDILQENPSTLRSRISKGRKLLGEKLKENGYGRANQSSI